VGLLTILKDALNSTEERLKVVPNIQDLTSHADWFIKKSLCQEVKLFREKL
jgi:hypothetical protein